MADDVRGLALVRRHAERGVAFKMLDRAEALAMRQRDVLVGDVILKIDERLALVTTTGPRRRAGVRFRIGVGHWHSGCIETARGRGAAAERGTVLQCLRERKSAGGRAGNAEARRERIRHEAGIAPGRLAAK